VISIWIEEVRGTWFGVASHANRLVATATGEDRDRALRSVHISLPRGREHRLSENGSEHARALVQLLARLEAGVEEAPGFDLCPDCVGETVAAVAHVASAVLRGYVATYGGIAASAGSEARIVGQVMATNPLYPLIPCHRVVGADLSLVGYTGSREDDALRAKLTRLRAEARGFTAARTVTVSPGSAALTLYPVEQALARAVRDGLDEGSQLKLF